jgi:hypothetical protein
MRLLLNMLTFRDQAVKFPWIPGGHGEPRPKKAPKKAPKKVPCSTSTRLTPGQQQRLLEQEAQERLAAALDAEQMRREKFEPAWFQASTRHETDYAVARIFSVTGVDQGDAADEILCLNGKRVSLEDFKRMCSYALMPNKDLHDRFQHRSHVSNPAYVLLEELELCMEDRAGNIQQQHVYKVMGRVQLMYLVVDHLAKRVAPVQHYATVLAGFTMWCSSATPLHTTVPGFAHIGMCTRRLQNLDAAARTSMSANGRMDLLRRAHTATTGSKAVCMRSDEDGAALYAESIRMDECPACNRCRAITPFVWHLLPRPRSTVEGCSQPVSCASNLQLLCPVCFDVLTSESTLGQAQRSWDNDLARAETELRELGGTGDPFRVDGPTFAVGDANVVYNDGDHDRPLVIVCVLTALSALLGLQLQPTDSMLQLPESLSAAFFDMHSVKVAGSQRDPHHRTTSEVTIRDFYDLAGHITACSRDDDATARRSEFMTQPTGGSAEDRLSHIVSDLASCCIDIQIKESGATHVNYGPGLCDVLFRHGVWGQDRPQSDVAISYNNIAQGLRVGLEMGVRQPDGLLEHPDDDLAVCCMQFRHVAGTTKDSFTPFHVDQIGAATLPIASSCANTPVRHQIMAKKTLM